MNSTKAGRCPRSAVRIPCSPAVNGCEEEHVKQIILVSIALAFAFDGAAATVKHLTLAELVATSDAIVVGTVENLEYRTNPARTRVEQTVQITIETTYRGAPMRTVRLSRLGGTVGRGEARIRQTVPGQAQFETGERVLLFLQEISPGQWVTNGMGQGKFSLVGRQATPGVVYARRTLEGLNLVGGPSQFITLDGLPDNALEFPLSQLLSLIAGERPVREPLILRRERHAPSLPSHKRPLPEGGTRR